LNDFKDALLSFKVFVEWQPAATPEFKTVITYVIRLPNRIRSAGIISKKKPAIKRLNDSVFAFSGLSFVTSKYGAAMDAHNSNRI
jgi:hypothetical protein